MRRLKVMLGALFAVGCVAAIGASSASALTFEECKTPDGTSTNVICDGGSKKWTPVAGAVTVKPSLTSANSTLKSTVAGVEFEIVCTGLSGTGTAKNVESADANKHMGIEGSATTVSYESCAVSKPAGKGCTVPSTITTNSLKSETVTTTDKQKYVPEAGTTFVTFTVGGGAECPTALKGSKSVTGSATADGNEATGEQEFTATSGSELKYAGQTATFLSKNKFTTSDGTQVFPRTP